MRLSISPVCSRSVRSAKYSVQQLRRHCGLVSSPLLTSYILQKSKPLSFLQHLGSTAQRASMSTSQLQLSNLFDVKGKVAFVTGMQLSYLFYGY